MWRGISCLFARPSKLWQADHAMQYLFAQSWSFAKHKKDRLKPFCSHQPLPDITCWVEGPDGLLYSSVKGHKQLMGLQLLSPGECKFRKWLQEIPECTVLHIKRILGHLPTSKFRTEIYDIAGKVILKHSMITVLLIDSVSCYYMQLGLDHSFCVLKKQSISLQTIISILNSSIGLSSTEYAYLF